MEWRIYCGYFNKDTKSQNDCCLFVPLASCSRSITMCLIPVRGAARRICSQRVLTVISTLQRRYWLTQNTFFKSVFWLIKLEWKCSLTRGLRRPISLWIFTGTLICPSGELSWEEGDWAGERQSGQWAAEVETQTGKYTTCPSVGYPTHCMNLL